MTTIPHTVSVYLRSACETNTDFVPTLFAEVAKMIDYGIAWNDGRYDTGANKKHAIGTVGFNPPVSQPLIPADCVIDVSGTISPGTSSLPR
jgi:hypothetical protein